MHKGQLDEIYKKDSVRKTLSKRWKETEAIHLQQSIDFLKKAHYPKLRRAENLEQKEKQRNRRGDRF